MTKRQKRILEIESLLTDMTEQYEDVGSSKELLEKIESLKEELLKLKILEELDTKKIKKGGKNLWK